MEFAPLQPVDRISNLPENVIADILMCLPTRDAASTSILSKQWRYKWVKLPHLIFDVTVWQEFKVDERTMRFFLFLYQVLLRHQGPITKFSLVIPRLKSCSHIDHVINFLSNYGVEEFIFEIYKGYRIPSSLFMYLQLKRLTLSACLINPPPAFKGFNRLVRMELCDVIIDAEVLQSLISSCLLLEQLLLDFRNEFDFLEIDAPMLRLFHLRRFFCSSICIKRSQHLATVRVTSRQHIMADEFNYGNCNFVGFFDSLPALHKLCMDFHFMLVWLIINIIM
ncbi:F-box FBD LRR-repeat At1g13570-like [Olea europaea subsp. europaea]|uniref:F-box FBD LRR-repeat At1g13570-like n=1 Tax=Olea europaea subsp. europaea TaxID=158383 RepID=A0A8S0SRM4_OLEEU|nr:F-box FBD LRR-repeat At1g13570-like [Olea europaea subsp. europaea]